MLSTRWTILNLFGSISSRLLTSPKLICYNPLMHQSPHNTRENFFRYTSPFHLEEKKMEKPIIRNCSDQFWFAILTSFVLFSVLLCFDYSTFYYDAPNNGFTFSVTKRENPSAIMRNKTSLNSDPCRNRYIYIHDLPTKFNYDILKNCEALTRGTEKPNMCPYIENFGFGAEIENSEGVFTNSSWYFTNQFMLEIIFHNKMKRYECLSNDSSLASAIFVPFYSGLDVSRFLWESNETVRDSSGRELLQWLANKSEWKRMWGRDHFLVSGRIAWDFRRQFDNGSSWGSKFRFLPESMNMSMLAVEASSWKNDYAIPYPTSFHPSKDTEILQWQSKIRQQKRVHLFTFIGAARPELENSIRGKIIDHCRNSSFCNFFDCSYGGEKCDNPINVMKVFENSVFCLQPSGDSYTRRSIFDSMLAGCIPVFFHPGTAYSQYLWHLPKYRTKYSVYIPVKDVKEWINVNVEKVLLGFSEHEISAMREVVINLVPSLIYADSRDKLERFEDAFDLAVKGMLEKIERVRQIIRHGKDPGLGFADEDHYKYTFSNYQS